MPKTAYIRHALTKADGGERPILSDLTKEEAADLRKIATLSVVVDEIEGLDINTLTCVEIVYDGISYSEEMETGLSTNPNDGQILGHPTPILAYHFSVDVDPEIVRNAVWETWVKLHPSGWDEDMEPYIAEDHNGFTSALEENDVALLLTVLDAEGLRAGKQLTLDEAESFPFSELTT